MRTCQEDCEAVPPTPALRLSFREVSDRARREMVCCGGDLLVMWTIVLDWRRRESESLYDRARCERLRALCICGASSVCSGIVARSVARGYSGGRRGLHAASLGATRR